MLLVVMRLALETPAGERWLVRQAQTLASSALVGDLRVQQLRLIGWSSVEARGIELLSTEGEQLAFVASAHGTLSLPLLLKRRVHLKRLEVRGLHAELVPDPSGELPIVEALQPKEDQKQSQSSGFAFSIENGEVTLGRIRYFSDTPSLPEKRAWKTPAAQGRARSPVEDSEKPQSFEGFAQRDAAGASERVDGEESVHFPADEAKLESGMPALIELQGGTLRGRLHYRPLKRTTRAAGSEGSERFESAESSESSERAEGSESSNRAEETESSERSEPKTTAKAQGQLTFALELQTHLKTPGQGEVQARAAGLFQQGSLSLSTAWAVLPGGIELEVSEAKDPESPLLPPLPHSLASPEKADFFTQFSLKLHLPISSFLPYGGPLLSEEYPGRMEVRVVDQEILATLSIPQSSLKREEEVGGGEIRLRAEFKGAPKPSTHVDAEKGTSRNATPSMPSGPALKQQANEKSAAHFELFVEARNIDPSRLLRNAPTGSLFAAASLKGRAAGLPEAQAQGELWLAPSIIEGLPLGPGNFRVQAHGRELELVSGQISVPGARLESAQGKITLWPEAHSWQLDSAQAKLDFSDLGLVEKSLRSLKIDSPELKGSGELQLVYESAREVERKGILQGQGKGRGKDEKTEDPLHASSEALGVAGIFQKAARFRLQFSSALFSVKQTAFSGLHLDFRKAGPRLLVQGEAQSQPGMLWLDGEGVLGEEELKLQRFDLALGEVRWLLAQPTQLSWTRRRLQLPDFSLNGPGHPSLSLNLPLDQSRRLGNPKRSESKTSKSKRTGGGNKASAPPKLEAKLQISQLKLSTLRPLLPQHEMEGLLSLNLELKGSQHSPKIEAKLDLDSLEFDTFPQLSTSLKASLSPYQASIQGWLMVAGGALLNLEAKASSKAGHPLLGSRGGFALVGFDAWNNAALSAEFSLNELNLQALSREGLLPSQLRGFANAELRLLGTLNSPSLEGKLEFKELSLSTTSAWSTPELTGELQFQADKSLSAEFKGQLQGMPDIFAQAEIQRSLGELMQTRSLGNPSLSASLHLRRGPVRSLQSDLFAEEAALDLQVGGTLLRPTLFLRGDAEGLQVMGSSVGRLKLTAELSKQASHAQLSLFPLLGGPIELKLSGPGWEQASPWSGQLHTSHSRLDFLKLFPRLRVVEGAVLSGSFEIHSREPSELPRPPALSPELWIASGNLNLAAKRVAIAQVGTFQELELRLKGSESSLIIEDFEAKAEGDQTFGQRLGSIQASGAFHLLSRGWRLALDASSDNFPVPTPLKPAGSASTELKVRLAEQDRHISGKIELGRGELKVADRLPDSGLHPVTLPPDYIVHGPRQLAAEKPKPWEHWLASRTARIDLSVPPGFWIRSTLANVDVSAETALLWDGSKVELEGSAEVVRGTLILVRRRFDVDRLVLSFVDRPLFDPDIDARLLLDDRDLQVTLQLSGHLRSPKIDLTSDPPMSPAELALLLASGGGGGLAVGSGVAGSALSGALNLVAGQLGQAISDFLPLDVLAFELGPSGEARQIEAGTYITPDLFVSYIRNLFAQSNENTNEVQAEYRLGKRTSLRTRFGDRQSGGIEVLYQITLRSRAQRKAAEERESERGRRREESLP